MTRFTSGLLTTKDSHLAFRAAFRRLARARKLSAQHMALHAIVTGKPLGKAFSPVTNPIKLANGQHAWASALAAIRVVSRYPDANSQALLAAAGLRPEDLVSAGACTPATLAAEHGATTGGQHA